MLIVLYLAFLIVLSRCTYLLWLLHYHRITIHLCRRQQYSLGTTQVKLKVELIPCVLTPAGPCGGFRTWCGLKVGTDIAEGCT